MLCFSGELSIFATDAELFFNEVHTGPGGWMVVWYYTFFYKKLVYKKLVLRWPKF